MRRRGAQESVRESLSAWYWQLSKLYDEGSAGECAKVAHALDAGGPVVLPAYEVEGAGVHGLVRVEPDGSVVAVDWNPAARCYEAIA